MAFAINESFSSLSVHRCEKAGEVFAITGHSAINPVRKSPNFRPILAGFGG